MSHLSLYLLGPPRIERDGEPIQVDTRKAIALLAYLAISREGQRRDTLVNLLWPEYDQAHGRAALRRTLSALRKALVGDCLDADREDVSLNPDANISAAKDLVSPEAQAALAGRFLRLVEDTLSKCGGRVEQSLGTGVLGVLGATQIHESDPELAIRAAIEIRGQAQELGLDVSIGINTGQVYWHRSPTLVGTVVDLAVRLTGKARAGMPRALHRAHPARADPPAKPANGHLPAHDRSPLPCGERSDFEPVSGKSLFHRGGGPLADRRRDRVPGGRGLARPARDRLPGRSRERAECHRRPSTRTSRGTAGRPSIGRWRKR